MRDALRSQLFRTSGANPGILIGAAAVMVVVTLAATLLPAQAAARVDPATLLRS
jgi:ABC-type lipoprotein release transport system permease subunit